MGVLKAMRRGAISALVLSGLLATAGGATAADLGGDCCADLEERVAELEATTARKGNRKVSLTITGFVAQQIVAWDDGNETNAYVQGLGLTIGGSQFNFVGSAQINSEWSAGYVLHIETNTSDPLLATNQDNDDGVLAGIFIVESKWFLKSKRLGTISVGQMNQASDNAAILPDASGTLLQSNWVIYEGTGFFANVNGARVAVGGRNLQYADIGYCATVGLGIGGDCNGAPSNTVRYDTPTFGGFSASAGWGEDDFWDVALRYAGKLGDFQVAVAGAYSQTTDEGGNPLLAGGGDNQDVGYFQVGGYIEHNPSGLFVYGAYGTEQIDNAYRNPLGDADVAVNNLASDNPDHWMIKAGIKTKLNSLGTTVFWGEYSQYNDGLNPAVIDAANATSASSQADRWGLGVLQNIDAAAMQVWLKYRNLEADVTLDGNNTELDDFDIIAVGGLIAF